VAAQDGGVFRGGGHVFDRAVNGHQTEANPKGPGCLRGGQGATEAME
jgi:hypothetical protein